MDDSVESIFAHCCLQIASQLNVLLDLNPVINLLIIHLSLTEDESLQVNDKNLRKGADFSLFRNVPQLLAVVAVQLFSPRQVLDFEELSQDVVEGDR